MVLNQANESYVFPVGKILLSHLLRLNSFKHYDPPLFKVVSLAKFGSVGMLGCFGYFQTVCLCASRWLWRAQLSTGRLSPISKRVQLFWATLVYAEIHIMSLKFGIYLVEQRIVSPEQFCGLVKIQQGSTRSVASLAIAQNCLTMKQVSRILDKTQDDETQFIDVALSNGLLERSDASHLLKLQQQSGETIRSLVVECGLLTARQAEVLYSHFQRQGSRQIDIRKKAVAQPAPAVPQNAKPIVAPTPKFKRQPIIKSSELRS